MIKKLGNFDRKFGIRFSDNPRGILSDRLGGLKHFIARKRFTVNKDAEIVEDVKGGAHEIGNISDDETIDRIRERLKDHVMDNQNATVNVEEGIEIYRYANFDYRNIEPVRELLKSSIIERKVRSYFGSDFEISNTGVIRYGHIPSEKNKLRKQLGNTRNWHFDTGTRVNALRMIVFLTNQEERGSFQVIDSDKSKELLEEFDYEYLTDNPDKISESADVQEYGGKKGYSILCDVINNLHRGGGPPEGEERMILIASFVPRWRS